MLKLNIYEKGIVVKTHEAETADILYGTVQDLVEIVDIEKVSDLENKESLLELAKTVVKVLPLVQPFLKEIFPDLTDEELRKVKVKELIPLVVDIVKYSFEQIVDLGDSNEGN